MCRMVRHIFWPRLIPLYTSNHAAHLVLKADARVEFRFMHFGLLAILHNPIAHGSPSALRARTEAGGPAGTGTRRRLAHRMMGTGHDVRGGGACTR